MGNGIFVKPSHLATADSVLSASSEAGATVDSPVAGTSNKGALRLRSSISYAPTAVTTLDVALQTGGLANGYSLLQSGTPGSSFRFRNTGDASDEWVGHTDGCYWTYSRMISAGSIALDYVQVSEPRQMPNGQIAFVRVVVGVNTILQFVYKSARTDSWSTVTIKGSNITETTRPAWCILPSGRIIAMAHVSDVDRVDAWYSDDFGQTWAAWSTYTGVSEAPTICMEVAGDSICVVTGASETATADLTVYWSLDGGQTFSSSSSGTTAGIVRTTVTKTGQVLCAYSNTSTGVISVYPVLFGGGLGAAVSTGLTTRTGQPMCAFTTLDDGTIWIMSHGTSGVDPLTAIKASASNDNGATYGALAGTGNTIFDNETDGGTPRGFLRFVVGAYVGSLVVIGVTDTATATYDNGNVEMWFGGYDSLTETFTSATEGPQGTGLYNHACLAGDDVPDNLGWTKNSTGAGSTATPTANGINISNTLANYSDWTYPAGSLPFDQGDGFRFRYVFRINSGGTIAGNSSIVRVAVSDTTNRQWFAIRHGPTQMRLVDNSGTLATSGILGDFSVHTEVYVAFAHDAPSAGGGTISVWFRSLGDSHWTALCQNQAVAEEAGVATEQLIIGALDGTAATDWDISMFGMAEGGRNYAGFTNPTDLHGRALSSSIDVFVKNNVRLGGAGGPGVQGDTYTVRTGYQYGGRNLWLTPRLSCQWRTAADAVDANAVLYNAGNTWRGNVLTLHGTNYRKGRIQFNTSDSWGSPAYSAIMDATVWQGVVSTSAAGYVKVSGAPWIPHRYRSESGRRWFVTFAGAPDTTYEIDDNGNDVLYVEDLPTGLGGSTCYIFGDRMGVVLGSTVEYAYARLLIEAQVTADDQYRTGLVVMNERHDISEPYDNGFVDRYVPNVRVSDTIGGQVHVSILGPEHPELRIAWGLVDRMSNDYLDRVIALFRALRGEHGPVVFWRDTNDVSTLGLYRVLGPPVKENSYGELHTELARLAQVIMREETT